MTLLTPTALMHCFDDTEILVEFMLSISLSGRAIFHSTLSRGYILQYTPYGEDWIFCVSGNTLVQEGNIDRVNF